MQEQAHSTLYSTAASLRDSISHLRVKTHELEHKLTAAQTQLQTERSEKERVEKEWRKEQISGLTQYKQLVCVSALRLTLFVSCFTPTSASFFFLYCALKIGRKEQ